MGKCLHIPSVCMYVRTYLHNITDDKKMKLILAIFSVHTRKQKGGVVVSKSATNERATRNPPYLAESGKMFKIR